MMSVDSVSYRAQQSQKRYANSQEVQSVFSEVLASVGVDGYQSAQPLDVQAAAEAAGIDTTGANAGGDALNAGGGSDPLGELAADAWYSYYDLEMTGRYRSLATSTEVDAEQVKADFGNVISRSYNEGGYADPKQFLSSLSAGEMESIRQVHYLAEPINVSSLTEEGALNLLIPSVAQVDLNNDGLTQAGAGYGIKFPDSRTPADVAAAWEDATAELSPMEKGFYTLQVKLPALLANIKLNPDGSFSHVVEPGDPAYENPMASPDYSYEQSARDLVEYLDAFETQIDPVRYIRDRAFWSDFASRLADK
ncbi:hypothetical protein SAMN06265222_11676 [Neorhodopirellula lusitana]|uniref:Uncharacterized protein n=1 Tax=Neorhodopirellula lusitana TaxID=445327 RepID=A0ABY1QJH7_9BACT|nr:hypothetical protein [Neorhodopirellula lusitana]SMP73280.1 hypothetical protein SAMN06265222_11676 [Neorhodopirellula lusitana]